MMMNHENWLKSQKNLTMEVWSYMVVTFYNNFIENVHDDFMKPKYKDNLTLTILNNCVFLFL